MSSKSDEKGASTETAARKGRAWSLTIWLTLFNASSAFIILALIAALLYGGLASQLKNQNHLYLHDEVRIIENLARSNGNEAELLRELGADQSGIEYVKHYIRLMDRQERIILETPRMQEVIPTAAFPIPSRDGRPGIDRTWRAANGNLILSTVSWIHLGMKGDQGILQVALDVTNVENILVDYRRKIYLALVFGFLLCVLVSLAVARRGTKPLLEMTEIVRGITVSRLQERISGRNWPKELNLLADAMNLMQDRLQDSFSRLYNSANNLTHKMRTPLTILKGEAEVALSRDRSVEELQQVIISSLEENARLSRLGDNIFFLANADMGKLELTATRIDAREEIEKVIDYYSPLAEEREVGITCQGSATLIANAPLFRKAVAALISNAFTYNKSGGEVVVSLVQGEGGCCEVRVTDTGCGIAEAEMEKIFDRFYRIYTTRHMDSHGTGLGLPIARAIMELHGGAIVVESQPLQGTAVTLRFIPIDPA
jgi:two-component system, OmpR family, heavy metal sensor histidine kinase CusS